jgi:hypothetical protein
VFLFCNIRQQFWSVEPGLPVGFLRSVWRIVDLQRQDIGSILTVCEIVLISKCRHVDAVFVVAQITPHLSFCVQECH